MMEETCCLRGQEKTQQVQIAVGQISVKCWEKPLRGRSSFYLFILCEHLFSKATLFFVFAFFNYKFLNSFKLHFKLF